VTGEGISLHKWADQLPHKKDFQHYMLGSAIYVLQSQGIAPEEAWAYLRQLTFYLLGQGPVPNPPQKEEAVERQHPAIWTPGQPEGLAPGRGSNTLWVPGAEPRG